VPDGVIVKSPHDDQRWLMQGVAGRTVRFVDSDHAASDAMSRIASAYPGAHISVLPLALREIVVALARRSGVVAAPAVAVS